MSVLLETTVGDIVLDLFTDERPRACLNFLKLCKIKYYNYCLFHFVQRNFTAQTGDPTGTGKGGESIFRVLYGDQAKFFDAEVKPRLKHINKGTLSMVNNGDNMHGSQFFITLAEELDYLDGVHTVFGEVSEGFDVLDKIGEAICNNDNRPYQDIRISHTVILDDPYDDPKGLPIPDRSPEPTKEQLESGLIGADEKIDDTEGKTTDQIDDMIAEREEKAGTQLLEMIGDLPDAEVKPPDNVLFVCKLNPVTTDEDMEIIFSRFGTITSCEVIRDPQNGESLQYAFIEFEKPEDCERAYFKMDNVLIDDRRIHVDFSQSVSKLKWQKQGARPVVPDKKAAKPKYAIKDRTKQDKYDLVFDEKSSDSDDERPRKKKKSEKEKTDRKESKTSHRENDSDRLHKDRRDQDGREDRRDQDGREDRRDQDRREDRRDKDRKDERHKYRDEDDEDRERKRKDGRDDWNHRREKEDRYRKDDSRRSDEDYRHKKSRHREQRSPSPHSSRDRDRVKHRDKEERSMHRR